MAIEVLSHTTKLMIQKLGQGLAVRDDELVPIDIAYVVGDYVLEATARPGGRPVRLAGGMFEGARFGGVEGTIKSTIPDAVVSLLNRFKNDLGGFIFNVGADAMYEVLQEAITNAPFWDKNEKKRPEEEGPHLQESGILTYGMNTTKTIAYVENVLGSEREDEVTVDEIVYNRPKNVYIKNPVQFWIKFYRENPKTGWDVALWRHEDLLHPRSKYLEKAFQQVRPDEKVLTKVAAYVKKIAPNKNAERKAMELIRGSLTKGNKTWRGR